MLMSCESQDLLGLVLLGVGGGFLTEAINSGRFGEVSRGHVNQRPPRTAAFCAPRWLVGLEPGVGILK